MFGPISPHTMLETKMEMQAMRFYQLALALEKYLRIGHTISQPIRLVEHLLIGLVLDD